MLSATPAVHPTPLIVVVVSGTVPVTTIDSVCAPPTAVNIDSASRARGGMWDAPNAVA